MTRKLALLASFTAGCIVPMERPRLGACADYGEGPETYGQVGIGTCLAAPADLKFYEADGRTWLLTTNTNAYSTFEQGSMLAIDFDSIDTTQERVLMSEVDAHAFPIENLLGEFVIDPSTETAFVTSRLSPESRTRRYDDRVWMVDVSDPTSMSFLDERKVLSVRQDPFAIEYDEQQDRAYVVNMSDHTVSIIDTSLSPPQVLDPYPTSIITEPELTAADPASTAEINAFVLDDFGVDMTDFWTATWLEGSWRSWVPEGEGLRRWDNGPGLGVPNPIGLELDPADSAALDSIEEPFFLTTNDSNGILFSSAGNVWLSVALGASEWGYDNFPLLAASLTQWPGYLTAPASLALPGEDLIFFEGRSSEEGLSEIGVAASLQGNYIAETEPVITAPDGFVEVLQPFPLVDPNTSSARMWFTLFDGANYSIGLSESTDDGLTWTSPEEVLALAGAPAGAPTVLWRHGRYEMWFATIEPGSDTWSYARTFSVDGREWSGQQTLLITDIPSTTTRPPRAAFQQASQLGWRIEGDSSGEIDEVFTAGEPLIYTTGNSANTGFQLEFSTGHVLGTEYLGDTSHNGLAVGSLIELNGVPTMYVSAIDRDGRSSLHALQRFGTTWLVAAEDLVPEDRGGNQIGATDPVVFFNDGTYHLFYGGTDDSGITWVYHSTSDNGLNFQHNDRKLYPNPTGWASVRQLPHSVEATDEEFILWFTGFDGRRSRIGNLSTSDFQSYALKPGLSDDWVFGQGLVGNFDEQGVSDPLYWAEDGAEYLLYSGQNTEGSAIGLAERDASGAWVRLTSPVTNLTRPLLIPSPNSFSNESALSPTLLDGPDGLELWYTGFDGVNPRIGVAQTDLVDAFPIQTPPTAGDTLTFTTRRGVFGQDTIPLIQVIDGTNLPGVQFGLDFVDDGPTATFYDEEAGFLYVGSKSYNGIIVLDMRDDTTADFVDLNYLDIETVLTFDTPQGVLGFYDIKKHSNGLLYLASRRPDSIIVADSTLVEDNAVKEFTRGTALDALPVSNQNGAINDEGASTQAAIGIYAMELIEADDLLIATHFLDNSLSIFDLDAGPYGEEVSYVQGIAETPASIAVSPDGKSVVIAAYSGLTTINNFSQSSLIVVDIDPDSETYLQVLTRLVNQ